MNRKRHAQISAISPAAAWQLDQITRFLCENHGADLVGVYFHGSLAMHCFQPGASDLDVLVLLSQPPAP